MGRMTATKMYALINGQKNGEMCATLRECILNKHKECKKNNEVFIFLNNFYYLLKYDDTFWIIVTIF